MVVQSGGSVGSGSGSMSPAVCEVLLEGLLYVLASWLVMVKEDERRTDLGPWVSLCLGCCWRPVEGDGHI